MGILVQNTNGLPTVQWVRIPVYNLAFETKNERTRSTPDETIPWPLLM